jgi:hypothetical protein
MEAVRVVAAIVGAAVVLLVLFEAFRTFVVPRGLRLRFSRPVVRIVFRGLGAVARRLDAEGEHAVMVHAGPLAVLALPLAWLLASLVAYAGIFWAIDGGGFGDAVVVSGSSLFTLGFDKPAGVGGAVAAFGAAGVGLALLAVVISYLPSLNQGFARREAVVAMLDARAGVPPTALTLIERHYVYAGIEHFDLLWEQWEQWIVDVGQTHTAIPMLTLFRSAEPAHSWITASGAIIDAANVRLSAIQASGAGNASAWFFYRAATGVLARLAGFFRLDLRPAPQLERGRFERALDHLDGLGVPLVADRDQAWHRFTRRWEEYEPIVSALGRLVEAPPRRSPF